MNTQKTSDWTARWALVLFATLIPIFVIPQWATVAQSKILLLALATLVGVVTWLFARSLEGGITMPKSILAGAAALLPIAYAASALWYSSASSFVSLTNPQDTVVTITLLFAIFLLVVLTAENAYRAQNMLLRGFFIGAAVLLVFQALRLAFPDMLSLGVLSGSASTLLGSWHDFGIVLGLLVFLSLALFTSSVAQGAWRWVIGVVGLAALFALLIVNWVDVWFGLAAVLVFGTLYHLIGAWAWGTGFSGAVRHAWLWILVTTIALAGGFGSSYIAEHIPAPLEVVQVEVRPSWTGTYAVGEKVFNGGPALLFGSGPNTFSNVWGQFKPSGVNVTNFWNIDFNAGVGLVPTSLITVGVLGALAWGIFYLTLLWRMIHLLFVQRGTVPIHPVLLAVVGSAAYLFAFLMLYVPGMAVMMLAFLFLGLTVIVVHEDREKLHLSLMLSHWKGALTLVVAILLALVFMYAALTSLRATVSDVYVGKSISIYNESLDTDAALAQIQTALRIYPDNDRAERAAVELGLITLQNLIAAGDSGTTQEQLQASLSQTVQHGLSAVSINSRNYQNWLALANLYQNLAGAGVEGAAEEAQSAFEQAAEANPTNPLPLISLSQLAASEGRADDAIILLDRAIELKPNLAAAYFLRSQLKAGKEEYEAAASDAYAVTQIVPEDSLGWYNLGTILYVAGAYQDTIAVLSQAISLRDDYSDAYFVQGLSYDQLGDKATALAIFDYVATLNPNDAALAQYIASYRAEMESGGKPTIE